MVQRRDASDPTSDSATQHRLAVLALKLGCLVVVSLTTANCANQPVANSGRRSSEIGAFSHPKYGAASPRVVADGEAVPKGGGRDMVGRPYSVAGRRYVPYEKRPGHTEVGSASWYGEAFHGRKTANGEVYDRHSFTAAHRTMPLPSYARVTNTRNGRSIIVRVNDRGPYHGNRIIDVSQRTAEVLDFKRSGTGHVKVDYVSRASTAGSDDNRLYASLKTDGSPATLTGEAQSVMVASAATSPFFSGAMSAPEPVITARVAPQATPVAEPVQTTAPETLQAVRVARGVPNPPSRPFDLATIPNAGTPVASTSSNIVRASAGGSSTRTASLFYAPPDGSSRLMPNGGFWTDLKQQTFQPLDLAER